MERLGEGFAQDSLTGEVSQPFWHFLWFGHVIRKSHSPLANNYLETTKVGEGMADKKGKLMTKGLETFRGLY